MTYDDDLYSDLHKDVYGFRPSGGTYEAWIAMTPAQKQVEWDRLILRLEEEQAARQAAQKAAVEAFEKRVVDTISLGAKNRTAALKWIYVAEFGTVPFDWDYLCYRINLPYGYFNKEMHS